MPIHNSELTPAQAVFSIPEALVHNLRTHTPSNPIIGQDRAMQALELGLGIHADGYNIFIMGASGTGRRTVLTSLLSDYKANQDELQDIAYVYNFSRPLEPKALFFPAGTGARFKQTMHSAIESIRRQALQITKSEVFSAASKKLQAKADTEENQLLSEFETRMNEKNFKLRTIKDDESRSMDLVPVYKNKPVTFEELQDLVDRGKYPAHQLAAVKEQYFTCLDQMAELFKLLREKRKQTEKQIRILKTESASPIIDNELALLNSLYRKDPVNQEVVSWLEAVREDLLSRVHVYTEPFKNLSHKKHFFGRYSVNLVCENSISKNYVIQEELPTFANLFGSIEAPEGTDESSHNGHLRIRPGAVHRAFGGYLVLRLQDVLIEDGSWLYLKRILQSGKVEIQNPPSSSLLPSVIKPQPLPINFKVILIGGEMSYDYLYQEDPDFQKLFKVCAEFDSVMPRTEENMTHFISFVDGIIKRNNFLPVDDSGVSRILTYASRVADDRTKITTRFTVIADLLREADFHARKEKLHIISGKTISATLAYHRLLQQLPEEKYKEMIKTKEILLDVTGTMIGKVNGLAVHDRGYLSFGIPVAVTAQAAPGNRGIINIEGESGLSGEIYDKAHLIIQGLLHRKFARDIPLAVSASICFEQSYTEVDGDSASCAAFFSLLSAIANLPLRQDIAVTGSLNQIGDVQPVGGIPEKIEAFFDACTILGLTGTQGVMIPFRNLNNLILEERVESAIQQKTFHIWAIKTVEEGLEILSGVPHEDFSLKVYKTLQDYARRMQRLLS